MKTFTIVSANKQDRKSFETEATTVGELLAELRKREISYSGMVLYEGLTKCTFDPDNVDGILPHDVPYKNKRTGEEIVTSNLVFMMSTKHKKTSSGAMTRNELLAEVKKLGLAAAVKDAFGIVYSSVKSVDLEKFLADYNQSQQEAADPANAEAECAETACPARGLILGFIHTALELEIIDTEDIMNILEDLGEVNVVEKTSDKKFDDDEINSMFAGR